MEKYRKIGCHLYVFNGSAYVHCYQDPMIKTKAALIRAYERAISEE